MLSDIIDVLSGAKFWHVHTNILSILSTTLCVGTLYRTDMEDKYTRMYVWGYDTVWDIV